MGKSNGRTCRRKERSRNTMKEKYALLTGFAGFIGKNHRDISVKDDVFIVSHEVIEIIRQCLGRFFINNRQFRQTFFFEIF